jgi:very-short-patch-repair endonuclease
MPFLLMAGKKHQDSTAQIWDLVRRQHGVVTRSQLLDLGVGSRSIDHRIATGRLHPLWRGVYADGRPEVDQTGRWIGAVLICGRGTLLSHRSAAALWGFAPLPQARGIDVVVPLGRIPRHAGIQVHRRVDLGPEHRREVAGIPVTDPVSTLVDFASRAPEWLVERAINEADRLDLVDPEALRSIVIDLRPRPGMACMRRVLGLDALTDTGLERKFLAIVRAANLPPPQTQAPVNGYRVDFYWPNLGLVVESDGWRYHRTAGEQATDHRRDQAHARAALTTLRFSESQIRYEPDEVRRTLTAVVARLSR